MSQHASHLDPYIEQAERTDVTLQEKSKAFMESYTRAMTPASPIEENQLTLVFIANKVTHKCDEVENDTNVNVSFYDPDTTNWASFCGKASITQDRGEIKKYWSTTTSAWFGDLKDGVHHGDVDDPRVVLIEVVPDEVRYWISTKGAIGRAVEAGVGMVTGKVACPGEIRTITKNEVDLTQGLHSK